MERRYPRDTHHTVSAGILEAVGKGFLIATAGVVAGALYGTANLAVLSLWMIAVTAASGAGCLIGSTLVRNAGWDRCESDNGDSELAPSISKGQAASRSSDIARDDAFEARWVHRTATSGMQRERGSDAGRGI